MRAASAFRRPASVMEPGPTGSYPLNFAQLVQPVLDRHCVKCHDGASGPEKSTLKLTGQPLGQFTESYAALRGFIRWYEWGGETIRPTVTFPGNMGADASSLIELLESTHKNWVSMSDDDWRRVYLWLDANSPFYGTYDARAQKAQQLGKQVAMPRLQ